MRLQFSETYATNAFPFFGRFAVPAMVRYLDKRKGQLDEQERDKLLFWFAQAAMWGRFSGSTETFIDQDLAALEAPAGGHW